MTEREQLELQQQAEYGRKAKIAQEIFEDFVFTQRAQIMSKFESEDFMCYEDLNTLKTALRILRQLTNSVERFIEEGQMAEAQLYEEELFRKHGKQR